jgi:hypothetical protein
MISRPLHQDDLLPLWEQLLPWIKEKQVFPGSSADVHVLRNVNDSLAENKRHHLRIGRWELNLCAYGIWLNAEGVVSTDKARVELTFKPPGHQHNFEFAAIAFADNSARMMSGASVDVHVGKLAGQDHLSRASKLVSPEFIQEIVKLLTEQGHLTKTRIADFAAIDPVPLTKAQARQLEAETAVVEVAEVAEKIVPAPVSLWQRVRARWAI